MSGLLPNCPYCSTALPKMPTRKSRCPACGLTIYVKAAPEDCVKRLVTEAEATAIEQRWHAAYTAQRDEQHIHTFGVPVPRTGAQQRALGRQIARRDLLKLQGVSRYAEISGGRDACPSCMDLEGVWEIEQALSVMPLPNEACERYRRGFQMHCCAFWGLPKSASTNPG